MALIRHPCVVEEDCRATDIVIGPLHLGQEVPPARIIVNRRMLKANGANALFIEGLSIRTESVASAHGRRPWRWPTQTRFQKISSGG
ncbi:MAG: hypothetical protein ACREDO_07490 [Methyloceanibacter sp.]